MRPYISLHVKSLHVGVVTRQMLQRWVVIRFGRFDNGRTTVRPYKCYSLGCYTSGHYTIPNKIGIFVDESFTTDFTNNFITYI